MSSVAVARSPKVPARLEHRSHGRVRVRVPVRHRTQDALHRVQESLESHPAVGKVTVNARTGSILLEGAHSDGLHAALDDVLEIFESGSPEEAAEAGVAQAVDAVKRLDQQLGVLTGGRLSLRWLVPTAFITVGVRQLLAQGVTIGAIPWYVLIYYGVDSFLKLYPEHAPKAEPHAPGAGAAGDAGG